MELLIVRHGEPDLSGDDLSDPPLTDLGQYPGPAFQRRVLSGFSDIVQRHPGETVAVVCHGGVINAVVKDVLDSKHPIGPNHGSITRVTASRSGVRSLTTFNEHHWQHGL
jgi:broad specificity phosphatase PhoE